jgi:glycosyltransferase involved in cell wall biosynthesis
MKAAVYSPYIDTLGGGERYSMCIATALVNEGYKVDVQWKNVLMKRRLEKRFSLDLSQVNFIKDVKKGDGYEVCFWVSDGSIPLLHARFNILHFQFPFTKVNGRTLLNRMKFIRINKIVCNSYFTKKFVDGEYGVKSIVIYPPVAVDKIRPKRKKSIIVFIGRFSQLTQAKRQDVLVDVFKKLYDSGYKDWELVLAGGVEVGVDDYVEKLRHKAKGYPIRIMESPSFGQIKDLYGEAKIFWSASGYGADYNKYPKKVEHFGITVVEAMAGGAVPVIYDAGGHKEIVADSYNGYLWSSKEELLSYTKSLISNPKLLRKLSKQAVSDSKIYEYERFEQEFKNILSK